MRALLRTSLTTVALAALVAPVSAGPNAPEVVIDVASGQVLHADEATRPWFPASTTKMMTAYVALRAIKAGQATLDTPLIASATAARQAPSKIGIKPGQQITLDNALKILMVKSANDVAVVIAEGIGGSVPGFAALMNQEAARLGMRESHFVNPNGLHHAAHVSSARDLALLGRALLTEFPDYRDYWGIGAVKLGNRVMANTNGLIGRYPGAEGMKTGFVCASGFNVVAVASQGGRRLLTVVLGSGSGAERTIRTAQLFDKSFSSWGGGGYGTLASLAGTGHASAPNMRDSICRKGKLPNLEEDDGGSISVPMADSGSVYAVMMPQQTSAARSVGSAATGRAQLGPRAELAAIEVYLGRSPGNTEVARGPGNAAVGARSASAFAAARPAAPVAVPAAIAAVPAGRRPIGAGNAPAPTVAGVLGGGQPAARPKVMTEDEENDIFPKEGAPLQLPGLLTGAPAPGAIGLRSVAATRDRTAGPGAITRGPAAAKAAPAARAGAIAARAPAKAEPARAAAKDAKKDVRKVADKAAAKTTGKTADTRAADKLKTTGKKAAGVQ